MSTMDTIKTPTLHSEWKAAKKQTKAAAEKAGEAAAYAAVKVVERECSRVEDLLSGALETALAQAREAHLKSQKWLDEHKEERAANPEYGKTATATAALLVDLRKAAKVYDQGFKALAALKKAVADGKARTGSPAWPGRRAGL